MKLEGLLGNEQPNLQVDTSFDSVRFSVETAMLSCGRGSLDRTMLDVVLGEGTQLTLNFKES